MVNGEWGTAVKIAVLCILAFQYVKAFSTPAIADIAAAYPMVSATDVKLIESIPSLMAIPGSLLVIVLERVMKKRSILLIREILVILSCNLSCCFMKFPVSIVDAIWSDSIILIKLYI